MNQRRSYSKEFKLEAVRLLESGQKPAADLARELGVKRTLLYRWRDQFAASGEEAFPGRGRQPDKDDEIARLKRELKQVTEERDILKKAARYFAKESE